jgi:hypothetical protein
MSNIGFPLNMRWQGIAADGVAVFLEPGSHGAASTR